MASMKGADSMSPTVPPSCLVGIREGKEVSLNGKGRYGGPTSMIQTSGSSPDSSTGILETRSIQSWIALVTCGTI